MGPRARSVPARAQQDGRMHRSAPPETRSPASPVRPRAGPGARRGAFRGAVRAVARAVVRAAVRAAVPAAVLLVVLLLAGAGGSAGSVGSAGQEERTARAAGFVPKWSWPLLPAPAVLRPFERPPRPWQRGHRGVDLAGAAPAAVLSPADGVVSFAGTVVDRGVLSIDHGGGRTSSFEPVTTGLVKGQRVTRGQAVAALDGVGPGRPRGHCAACLHWGVRVDGEYVDPLSFVTDRRPSVLLPLGG